MGMIRIRSKRVRDDGLLLGSYMRKVYLAITSLMSRKLIHLINSQVIGPSKTPCNCIAPAAREISAYFLKIAGRFNN